MFYVQRFLVVPFMLYHVSPDESLCEQGHLCFFLVVHKLDPDGTEGGRRQKDKHPIFAIPSRPNCHVRRRGTFQAWRCFFGGAPSNVQLKELSGCGVQDQVLSWESECVKFNIPRIKPLKVHGNKKFCTHGAWSCNNAIHWLIPS